MTATALRFQLDLDASAAQTYAKRALASLRRGSQVLFGASMVFHVWRARTATAEIRARLSQVEVHDASDRELMKDIATNLALTVKAVDEIVGLFHASRMWQLPLVGEHLRHMVEELACESEDVAETAALAASQNFADVVREELASFFAAAPHGTDEPVPLEPAR